MRCVVQRVSKARVLVDGNVVSSIGPGICVLVGISRRSTPAELAYTVRKLLNLRIFDGTTGKRWDRSVKDLDYEILCVSQFTLYSVLKGNKPDFHNAMAPDPALQLYNRLLTELGNGYNPNRIKSGAFGAKMEVCIENDGPVTIILEAPSSKEEGQPCGSKADG